MPSLKSGKKGRCEREANLSLEKVELPEKLTLLTKRYGSGGLLKSEGEYLGGIDRCIASRSRIIRWRQF
jgi:hypothetical protein